MAKRICAVILAFIYSFFNVIIGPMIKSQVFSMDNISILRFILCFLIFSGINLGALYLAKMVPRLKSDWLSTFFDRIGGGKALLLVWAFIFLSWIPAFLVFFPGVLSYDTISQIDNALTEIASNHHPVLHTFLLRVFMNLGINVFSGYEYGLGCLSLLQMLILSYAMARMTVLLWRKKVPSVILLFVILFQAFWYTNACLSVTMVKDTLHGAFFILFACHFAEIVLSAEEYMADRKHVFEFIFVGFMMCATRNNGLHIYVFCMVILLLLSVKRIKLNRNYLILGLAIVVPVLLYKVYTGPVFDKMGIVQGETKEALCIPIQQLQRIHINDKDVLQPEDLEKLDYYLVDVLWIDEYDPFFADPAKGRFVSGRYDETPGEFWKFYFHLAVQYPKEYVAAFLSNTLGFWYPGYYGYSYVMYDNYDSGLFMVPLERKSLVHSEILEKYYKSVCMSDTWREVPGVRLFFVAGFTPWILLLIIIAIMDKGRYFRKCFLILMPMIAQFGIMLLSPMSSFRYAWPLYLILPISFIGLWGQNEIND